jgi:hypothetical protein
VGNKVVPACTVSVYATKEGYRKSETATMEISLIDILGGAKGLKGDMNDDEKLNAVDVTLLIKSILGPSE